MAHRFAFIATCLVFATLAGAVDKANKPIPGRAIYGEFPEVARQWLEFSYLEKGRQLEGSLKNAKAAISKAKGVTGKEEAKARYEDLKKELENLRDNNDPPLLFMRIDGWHETPIGEINQVKVNEVGIYRWSVGDFGYAVGEISVIEITGPQSAILRRRIGNFGKDGTQTIILKGFSTDGWTDGMKKKFDQSETLWATGTTVTPGNNTLLVVEPFDWDRYRKIMKEKNVKK